jgi:hypothetical protein
MLLVQKFSAISHRKTGKKADKLNLSWTDLFSANGFSKQTNGSII